MNYKIVSLVLSGLFFNALCYAELRDPTKPASYSISKSINNNQPLTEDLKLSSIWVSGNAKRVTINGEKAKQGDTILSNVKVLKILNTSVLIKQNGVRKKLYLLTRSYKTRSSQ